MADRRPTAPSPSFGIQPPHAASTAMAPPPPQPTSSAEPRGTSPPAAAGSSSSSSSSLLHLLAAASSDLPAKISSSYHLHELPAAGSPRSNTSGTPGVQPAGAEGGASATSNGSGPAGASACGAAGPSGLKRKASSSVGPEEKKEIKNGNNKVTLSCAECRRRASPPSGRLPLVAAYGVDRTARADSRDHLPPPPPHSLRAPVKLKCDRVWPCSSTSKAYPSRDVPVADIYSSRCALRARLQEARRRDHLPKRRAQGRQGQATHPCRYRGTPRAHLGPRKRPSREPCPAHAGRWRWSRLALLGRRGQPRGRRDDAPAARLELPLRAAGRRQLGRRR
jgi:hypothetical protein